MQYARLPVPLQAAAALGVTALTGGAVWLLFNSGNTVAVAAPTPTSSSVQSECAALTQAAPQSVDNENRRGTAPSSPLTAAWGDPAITLRCGVPEPEILRPGSKTYDPTAEEGYFNGVAWLIEKTSAGYRFTAAQRAVYVEVDVPNAYSPQTSAVIDLSPAVIKAIPRNDGASGPDTTPAAGATSTASASASATSSAPASAGESAPASASPSATR
ncbi:MAG TPA: DUF3515 domain-containing protein [Actinocrinis sp.]|nr:DUF3515 domain-containing protein [Actinocrinis sp.]